MGCGCNKNKGVQPAQAIQTQQPAMPQAIPSVKSPAYIQQQPPIQNHTQQRNPSQPPRPQSYYQPTGTINNNVVPNVVGAWGPQKPTNTVGPLGPQKPGDPITIPPLPVQSNQGLRQTVETITPAPEATKKPYSIIDAALDTAKAAFGKEGVFVSEDVRQRRMDTCDACPHKKMARCTICGCVLDLKIRYTDSSCPIQKW